MRPEDKGIVAREELQELQEKFGRIHHIYSIYLQDDVLQDDIVKAWNWNGVGEYISLELCRDLLWQLRESGVEEVVEAELPVDYVKVCAVAVRVNQKIVARWLVGGILLDEKPEDVVLPENVRTTTREAFAETLEFMCSMFRNYFKLGMGTLAASEESEKSRQAEERMKAELKRSESMTSIVQMLESEQ